MSNYFEEEVFRRLDRMENKIDGLGKDHAALNTRVTIAEARQGWMGALAGGVVTMAGLAINYFRHK